MKLSQETYNELVKGGYAPTEIAQFCYLRCRESLTVSDNGKGWVTCACEHLSSGSNTPAGARGNWAIKAAGIMDRAQSRYEDLSDSGLDQWGRVKEYNW
jgi:hypothetical protein